MISTTQVWENVLIEIQARVTAFAYESWIEGLVPVCIYEDNVVLLCENSAKKRVVEERYIDVISESCKKVMPHNEGVLFILEEEREKYRQYRQYLRDIPEQESFPDEGIKTFGEWKGA